MKTSGMKGWMKWMAAGVAAAGLALFSAGAMAQEPGPEQVREKLRVMEEKARDLKADGKHEEAKAVMREAEELKAKFGRAEKERRGDAAGSEERRAAIGKKLDAMRAEAKELREAGKVDKAEEVMKRIHHAEEELAQSGRRGEGERGPRMAPEQAEIGQKIQHVREAVGHLHAAGLHEPADRLAQETEKMQQHLREASMDRRGPQPPAEEIERMRAEIQELRQMVRQLNARLDGKQPDKERR